MNASAMVLAINTGSSSLKFALFDTRTDGELLLAHGAIERVGDGEGPAWLQHGEVRIERKSGCSDQAEALDFAFTLLAQQGLSVVDIVGHRVVHGGIDHVHPERVDAALLESLHRLIPFAPLHQPTCLAAIRAVAARLPSTPQVACFDTAFHAMLPPLTRTLPVPARFAALRRYGFHGLSYEHVMATLGPEPPSRIVIAHLGNGASMVAVKNGRSIDTTMSLTPTGGILMSTRSGDLDPGILTYLARVHGMDAGALERCLTNECGLLAVGGASDMQTLLSRAATDPAAALAVEMFGYAVRKQIGAYAAALGGLDLLVFTGGIGESAAAVRAEACRGMAGFGIELDAKRNERGEAIISTRPSGTMVKVMKADEALVIARHTRRLIAGLGQDFAHHEKVSTAD